MGKSTLLKQLKDVEDYAFCRARKLLNASNPESLLGDATTLVIDALDEVSARREGDAVDAVLQRLDRLGQPRFILSCRVSDWRSATAIQGISDFYDSEPLELHLEPLGRDDALVFLSHSIDAAAAEAALLHFEERGLSGLWRNPQTLDLISKVAKQGQLPASKGELFEEATKLLRIEHRSEKSVTPLAQLPEKVVLDAAGAGFASLIITGKEALTRETPPFDLDVPIGEACVLPAADKLGEVLDSRLFEARGPDRFAYAHRAIGEFLGARWLAEQADTPRKQRRILELLNNPSLVPASLRGIHAWLAWHSEDMADKILESDPMGVIEYGDTDRFNAQRGRTLLNALLKLSEENPYFLDSSEYRAGGLVQAGMLPEVRKILQDANVEFGLRLLVLKALEGADITSFLHDELLALLLNKEAVFALRSEAGDRLVEVKEPTEWPDVVRKLIEESEENGARLASELMSDLGYTQFDDALVLEMIESNLPRVEHTVGVFYRLEREFPEDRLEPLLDGIAALAHSLDRDQREVKFEISGITVGLLARHLEHANPRAEQLWSWLSSVDFYPGMMGELHAPVSKALKANNNLRRAVQRHVLLELRNDMNIWQRTGQMLRSSPGLNLSEDDLLWLLDQMEGADPRWRELVELSGHGPEEGANVRMAAKRFAMTDDEALAWLAGLAERQVPDWQLEEERRATERAAQRAADWERHRAEFSDRIEDVRAGNYGLIVNPAKAYLGLFRDIGDEAQDGASRIESWLGTELKDAALAGFEAFLARQPTKPTAIEIANGYAEGQRWEAAHIIVAALAERARAGSGFDDLPVERLMAGCVELSHSSIQSHAGLDGLDEKLAHELRKRGVWEATLRLLLEPQFAAGRQHVVGLFDFLQSEDDAVLVVELGAEWLANFPQMSDGAEMEIVDRLLLSLEGSRALLELLPKRLAEDLSDDRRLLWDAVGIILDFDGTRARLDQDVSIDRDLFWSLRARLGGRGTSSPSVALNPAQLAWIIQTFRSKFPHAARPKGGTVGDCNAWDATDYLKVLVNRLGREATAEATDALIALRDAPPDGYTDHLRVTSADQKRKRVEANWVTPDMPTLAAAIADQPPTNAPQLQAVMLEELKLVQAKITGHPLDWYRDFIDPRGAPKGEEDCRDTILKMFGTLPFGIHASPEGHLADNKRCDIECSLPGIMVPIEVKGQWHKDLWTAADRQLDLLYTNDYRAERGIYLVLWFGAGSAKRPKRPPLGIEPPQSAEQLQSVLTEQSVTTREGRTEVFVLDLTRPT